MSLTREESLDDLQEAKGLLLGSYHALRSYQFGNSSEVLAETMADAIAGFLNPRGIQTL